MNSTKKSLEINKDRRPFWRYFFRGERGRFKLVSCQLFTCAACAILALSKTSRWLPSLSVATVCNRFESSMICFLSKVFWSNYVYSFLAYLLQ